MAGCAPYAVPSGRIAILDDSDQVFLAKAAERAIAAVQMDEIAVARGQSPDVRRLARQRMFDRRRALDAEFDLAHDKGMPLPKYSDAAGQALVRAVQQAPDDEFDSVYHRAAEENLSRSIELFREGTRDTHDLDVRVYALVALPGLEGHLRQVTGQ
jgi:predicted outer membrane protein